MYGQFVREMPETTDDREKWNCLRKANLKVETEAMLYVAQEQAIRTNYANTRQIKQRNYHFVECVTRKVKQYLTL